MEMSVRCSKIVQAVLVPLIRLWRNFLNIDYIRRVMLKVTQISESEIFKIRYFITQLLCKIPHNYIVKDDPRTWCRARKSGKMVRRWALHHVTVRGTQCGDEDHENSVSRMGGLTLRKIA